MLEPTLDASSPLRRQLLPGERLVWEGQPLQGIRLQPYDAVLIPFSLLWCGFAFFWEASALERLRTPGGDAVFALFGIPFCLVGLYVLAGRFFVDARRRARVFYGVTDRRVIICEPSGTTTLDLRSLPPVHVTEWKHAGTLTFGMPVTRGYDRHEHAHGHLHLHGRSRPPDPPAFEFIADVHRVHQLLEEARRATP